MLQILLCDDDPIFLEMLQKMVTQAIGNRPCSFSSFTRGEDCIAAIQNGFLPDLALVDISLPDIDGIEAAARIYQCCPEIPFIFLTAHNAKYSQSLFLKELNLQGYVVKPIDPEMLRLQISRALYRNTKEKLLCLGKPQFGTALYLEASEILYLESKGHYLNIHTADRVYLQRAKLSQVEPELEPDFLRIHGSYLVNIQHVQEMLTDEVVLVNGQRLPVSRSRAKAARLKFFRRRGMQV